jgi:hypothetical protein
MLIPMGSTKAILTLTWIPSTIAMIAGILFAEGVIDWRGLAIAICALGTGIIVPMFKLWLDQQIRHEAITTKFAETNEKVRLIEDILQDRTPVINHILENQSQIEQRQRDGLKDIADLKEHFNGKIADVSKIGSLERTQSELLGEIRRLNELLPAQLQKPP